MYKYLLRARTGMEKGIEAGLFITRFECRWLVVGMVVLMSCEGKQKISVRGWEAGMESLHL